MDIKTPQLKITRKTINNKITRCIIREAILDFIELLLNECPLTFNESISIVAGYYNIDVKVIKYFLKDTKFDQDVVCIVPDINGKKFLTHCEYIFLIYKTIHKIIVKLFFMNEKQIPLLKIIIEMVKLLDEYNKNSSAVIVFNAIKNELKKRASKYKNFYKKYLPGKILKAFDNINNPIDFSFNVLKTSNDIKGKVWKLKNNFYKTTEEISVILEIEVDEVKKYI